MLNIDSIPRPKISSYKIGGLIYSVISKSLYADMKLCTFNKRFMNIGILLDLNHVTVGWIRLHVLTSDGLTGWILASVSE